MSQNYPPRAFLFSSTIEPLTFYQCLSVFAALLGRLLRMALTSTSILPFLSSGLCKDVGCFDLAGRGGHFISNETLFLLRGILVALVSDVIRVRCSETEGWLCILRSVCQPKHTHFEPESHSFNGATQRRRCPGMAQTTLHIAMARTSDRRLGTEQRNHLQHPRALFTARCLGPSGRALLTDQSQEGTASSTAGQMSSGTVQV